MTRARESAIAFVVYLAFFVAVFHPVVFGRMSFIKGDIYPFFHPM